MTFKAVRLISLMNLLFTAGAYGQSASFAYQGLLKSDGLPANGPYDFQFTLYDAPTAGAAVSPTACIDNVFVTDGLFTTSVPLPLPTSGVDAFLEIQVRPGATGTCASSTEFVALTARQPVTPAPKAVYAMAVAQQSAQVRGALRFNPDLNRFEGFNGAWWLPLQTGTPITPANIQTFGTAGSHNFVVPAGVYSLGIDVWSGGAGGGGPSSGTLATSCSQVGVSCAGGGGGGGKGAYVRAAIEVTPGETLQIQVGLGGTAGSTNGDGGAGGLSHVARNGVVIARCWGPGGGLRGINRNVQGDFNGCFPLTSGAGGSGPSPIQFVGPGTVLGGDNAILGGDDGLGAACRQSNSAFCAAAGGDPVSPTSSPAPVTAAGAGAGGRGGSPGGTAATTGGVGRVTLFWN